MPRPLQTLRIAVLAAPWPCLTATGSALAAVGLWRLMVLFMATGKPVAGALLAFPVLGWCALAGICLMDAAARVREYHRFRAAFKRFGFRKRLARIGAASRCQRDAVARAAQDAGHGRAVRQYYRDLGYRWRHLLPDPRGRQPADLPEPGISEKGRSCPGSDKKRPPPKERP